MGDVPVLPQGYLAAIELVIFWHVQSLRFQSAQFNAGVQAGYIEIVLAQCKRRASTICQSPAAPVAFPETLGKHCYLFLDEVQNVPGWELWVRRLCDTEDLNIFVTGSSSQLLTRD